MAALPIRERILQALATRLNAHRGLEAYDIRDLPITVIVADEDSATESDYDMTQVSLPVTVARAIQVTGTKSDSWYKEGEIAKAQLHKDIYTGGEDLGGLADGVDYTGGSVAVLTDGARGCMVQVFVNIRYAHVHGNPFIQSIEE